MKEENYNLMWHSFATHLEQMLFNLREDEKTKDVTLVCDDKVMFRAHSIILMACSPVFSEILKDGLNKIIYLRGIKHQEMGSILQFMYLGQATFSQDRMREFLNVSRSLEIKELSKSAEMIDEEENQDNTETVIIEDNQEPKKGDKAKQTKSFTDSLKDIESVQSKRNDEPPFKCTKCHKTSFRRSRIREHFKTVHQGVRYNCKFCGVKYVKKSNLRSHIKAKHNTHTIYECEHCKIKFPVKQALELHIKSIHSNYRTEITIN